MQRLAMQKKTIALSLAAMLAAAAAGSVAYAQAVPHGPTRAEVQERASMAFDRLDVNVDGQIDAADRTEAVGERLRVRFDTADSNGDGALAFEEFSAARTEMRGEHVEGRRVEGRHGEGRRGQRGEMRGEMRGGRHGGLGMMGVAGTAADANRDGTITQAEFSAATLGHFDRADTNADGVMTREETIALRQTMRTEAQARRLQARPAAAAQPVPAQGS